MFLVVPFAEGGVRVEVDEHHFEDGAVDDTIEDT